MLEITKAIKAGNLSATVSKYNLKQTQHKTFPNLVSLCYEHTKSPNNKTTSECRGIVIDQFTGEVACYPFFRFHDKPENLKINFETAKFVEKIDGSIMATYVYDGKLQVASKSQPDGSGRYSKDTDETMAELFFKHCPITIGENVGKTIIWEFKHPYSFLTQSNDVTVTKIGERDMATMRESFVIADDYKTFKNQAELDNYLQNLDPTISEGLICITGNFDEFGNIVRYKCKSPQFEKISNLRTMAYDDESKRLNRKWLFEIACVNSHTSFLEIPKYQKFKTEYLEILQVIETAKSKLNKLVAENKHLHIADIAKKFQGNQLAINTIINSIKKPENTVDKFIATCKISDLIKFTFE